MKRFFLNFTLVVVLFVCGACSTVPYTGRRQFIITTESREKELGVEAWNEIKAKTPLSGNSFYFNALKRVGRNIAGVVNKPDYNWEFLLFDSNEPNAFCLPGGKIGVYSGIFNYIDNDAQLAAVIGHEIAHAVARHGGERISHDVVLRAGQEVLAGTKAGDEWLMAYGAGTQLGAVLPYSRLHEYEADKLGIVFVAKAGYDPREVILFWKKFASLSNVNSIGEFFSTHPMSEKRMEEMRKELPEVLKTYEKASVRRGKGEVYR